MKILSLLLFLSFLLPGVTQSQPADQVRDQEFKSSPLAKPGGGKWRIGYYQGGTYKDYPGVLEAMLTGLKELGWIERVKPECFQGAPEMKDVWDCVALSAGGPYIEFVRDAFYSSDWKKEARPEVRKEALGRLNKGDLDMVIAMGTWAGQDLANNEHHVPTIVASTSDPLSAGIIKSPADSGYDHVHAKVDPVRYARQVRIFHKLMGFKRLGVVYEDTPEGRTYAGINQIKPLETVFGFTIVPCYAPFSGVDLETSKAAVLECHKKLANEVDAFYLTTHRGVAQDNMKQLLEPFLERKIPVFAMGTDFEVKMGALLSMAHPDFFWSGRFYALTMARILNGAKPRSLNQVLEDPHKLAINIKTAKLIQFQFPVEYLAEATLYDADSQPGPKQ